MSDNGKGDAPRSCFSEKYRQNYDRIFRDKSQGELEFERDFSISVGSVGDDDGFDPGITCDVTDLTL